MGGAEDSNMGRGSYGGGVAGQGRRGENLEAWVPPGLRQDSSWQRKEAICPILHLLMAIHYGLKQDSVTKQMG